MTSAGSDPALDLAAQICSELSDRAPEGFRFTDQVIRQDEALQRLTAQLRAQPDVSEVERALCYAVEQVREDWTLLKLLELIEQLKFPGAAPALIELAQARRGQDARSEFLAGRACEVMLALPLDLQTRVRANEICKGPLQQIARYRLGAERERHLQRPRQMEWLLLVALMAIGIAALIFAAAGLGQR